MSDAWPDWKRAELERFRGWLDGLPDEAPEEPDEPAADLYALAEELTALKQEMRTLGRSTAQLAESSQTVSTTLKEELPLLLKTRESAVPSMAPDKEALRRASREAIRPFLIELGDLSVAFNELLGRDMDVKWPFYVSSAVRHQLESARSKPLSVLKKRVNALLSRHALTSLAAEGAPFDATRMNAAGVSREGAVPAGCVSAVARQGFICGEDVLRFAEVIVEENE